MRILHVVVNNKIATYTARDGHIVCGNSDYSLKFTFDSEWNEHTTKTARFVWNGKHFDQEFTGDECVVPVITNADIVEVGLFAGSLATTTVASIPCERSILCLTSEVHDSQVEINREQAMTAATEAKAAAKVAIEAAERAEQASAGGDVDLSNYYTKDETYSKNEIASMFGSYISEIDTLIGEGV